MTQRTVKVPVYIRIYKNRYEHFALIYKDSKFTNNAVFINLKHCLIHIVTDNTIEIVANNADGNKVRFSMTDNFETDDWIHAFSSNNGASSSMNKDVANNADSYLMQCLVEEEES